jgi:hypothetical protein
MEAIWKYTWNPNGYPLENVILNTSDKVLGDNVELAHTYFRGDNLTANTVEIGNLVIGEDIILWNKDTHLSELCNTPIYRTIQLNSKKAISSKLTVNVAFIADALDYRSLNQDLHQTADVTHNSIAVKSIKSDEGAIAQLNSDIIETPTFYSSEKGTQVNGDELSVNKTLINQEGIKFPSDEAIIRSGDLNYMRYDKATQSWVSVNKGTGDESSFIRYLKKPEPNKLTITTRSDLTTLDTIDWIEVDYENKGLILDQLSVNTLIINDKEFTLTDDTFKVGLLSVDLSSGIVSIGNIVFDGEMLNLLESLKAKQQGIS